jgi:hypothetical protein
VAEYKDQLRKLRRQRGKEADELTLETEFGISKNAVITRVERQFGGHRIPALVDCFGQLSRLPEFDPFTNIEICNGTGARVPTIPECGLDMWLAGTRLRELQAKMGESQFRRWLSANSVGNSARYRKQYSLSSLSKAIRDETGIRISRANLYQIITNPFYIGQFVWRGRLYSGTHAPLISPDLFEQVRAVLNGYNKPKYRKHKLAFRGILKCAKDGCMITAELKKGKYVYYRCTGGRGPCALPRFREQEIAKKLGSLLRNVTIPSDVAERIQSALASERANLHQKLSNDRARLTRELESLHRRMDAAYSDKLDGKITEDFWNRKQADWLSEEARIKSQVSGIKESGFDDRLLDVAGILELAQKAHSLYLTREPAEQGELLRKVLLNCSIDGINLYPTYRKPFDLICKRAKNEEWSGRADSNCARSATPRGPLAPKLAASAAAYAEGWGTRRRHFTREV